jgi:AcrR family transcriptional regulator
VRAKARVGGTRRRPVSRRDVRTELLHEATALIAERGLGAISLQDVASAVGVTKQSLLYYFDGKEALKLAVADHVLESANRSLNTLLAELPSHSSRRIEAILEHVNRFLEDEPHAAAVYLRFFIDGDAAAVERIKVGVRPWFGFLEDALQHAQRSGGIRRDLDSEGALLQIGMLVLTNFALLPMGWTGKASPTTRKQRLRDMVRTIELILFDR